MNTRENIQNIIRDLAGENFTAYPECYPIENGKLTDICLNSLDVLAEMYWDNRAESEIERDFNAYPDAVTIEDYKNWVLWKFESLMGIENDSKS